MSNTILYMQLWATETEKQSVTQNELLCPDGSLIPKASLSFLLPCIILNPNQRTKTGQAWERGYPDGLIYPLLFYCMSFSQTTFRD